MTVIVSGMHGTWDNITRSKVENKVKGRYTNCVQLLGVVQIGKKKFHTYFTVDYLQTFSGIYISRQKNSASVGKTCP